MSALVQLNGLAVTHATISLPRVGVWHAEVALEQIDAFSGQTATLTFGPSLSLTGAVRRSGSSDGTGLLILLGGSGNLPQAAKPQSYRLAPLRLPLGDLLSQSGDSLAASAQPEVLSLVLPYWVTMDGPIGQVISFLVDEAGASWRVLPDGTFWVGVESWPDAPAFDYLALVELPIADAFEFYSDSPNVLPGQTFNGRRVSYVEHAMRGDDLRSRVFLEAA